MPRSVLAASATRYNIHMRVPLWMKIGIAAVIMSLMYWTYTRMRPKIEIGSRTYRIELALTDAERQKGLSDRKSLGASEGMMFVFPTPGKYSFWMKGMEFPLDFIWIKGNTVVDITRDAPPESGPDYTLYRSENPSDKILELNAGEASRAGMKIGDPVKFRM